MKKIILIGAITASLLANIIISTGSKNGEYIKQGIRLMDFINKSSEVIVSKGSIQNLDRIVTNKAQIAIVQKDALAFYLNKHPTAKNKIEILGKLAEECVMLIAKKKGKIDDDDDLQKDGVSVAIGKMGSGSFVTWQYITSLESGFKKATALPKKVSARTLGKIKDDRIDAAFIVIKPNTKNKMFKLVNNDKELEFKNFEDWDLNDKLNGEQIYTFKKVKTQDGFFGQTIKTICTNAVVVANADLDEDIMDNIAEALLTSKKYIIEGAK